jgi:mRNA deadenylase 3'-5' endonuclease subunit Ccr4
MRVISYNILSSELSTEEEFPGVAPEYLEPATRLEKVMQKLESEIHRSSIICLQEVTPRWHNMLQAWFIEHAYDMTSVIYSTCLGVSIACPHNEKNRVCEVQYHPQFNSRMMILKLDNGPTIANVHIPCLYEDQRLMTDLCHKAYQAATVHNADVICGDFNSRPSSEAYHFLRTKWHSAMVLSAGHEPPHTCRAAHAPLDDFALDYIWISKQPSRVIANIPQECAGMLPNADEPSDHLMIAADITF